MCRCLQWRPFWSIIPTVYVPCRHVAISFLSDFYNHYIYNTNGDYIAKLMLVISYYVMQYMFAPYNIIKYTWNREVQFQNSRPIEIIGNRDATMFNRYVSHKCWCLKVTPIFITSSTNALSLQLHNLSTNIISSFQH